MCYFASVTHLDGQHFTIQRKTITTTTTPTTITTTSHLAIHFVVLVGPREVEAGVALLVDE